MPLRSIWLPILLHGFALAALGMTAIALPRFASLTVDIIIGFSFIVSAGVGLSTYFTVYAMPGSLWVLVWAVIAGLIGVLLIAKPEAALLSLTVLLIAYFLSHGIVSILAALEYQDLFPGSWGWGIVEGSTHLALAGLIWFGLPQSALWTLGTLVGVSLIMFGANLIVIALAARAVVEG